MALGLHECCRTETIFGRRLDETNTCDRSSIVYMADIDPVPHVHNQSVDAALIMEAAMLANQSYSKWGVFEGCPMVDSGFPIEVRSALMPGPKCVAWKFRGSGNLVLAFRGTAGRNDILADLKVEQVPMTQVSGVLVHEGFLEYYRLLLTGISTIITEYARDSQTIVLTGHSLGGAVATLGCAELSHQYPHIRIICVTFGSPRVGNADFANWYRERVFRTFRLVNRKDPVADLPHSGNYIHVCPAIIIRNNKGISHVHDVFKTSLTRLTGRGIHAMDHSMKSYLRQTQRWALEG